MKRLSLAAIVIAMAPAIFAQDIFTAQDLDDYATSMAYQVGSNNAAILDNIIQEGGYFAAMVHREPGPGFSESHDDWADLYFVTSGSATLVTGGTIEIGRAHV